MSSIGNKDVFAKNLRYYLEKNGKTQKEVGDAIGVPKSTIGSWATAIKYPRIDKIEALANYFGILKSDLIEDKDDERREMQKNNDVIADIVVKMRSNEDFLSIVKKLNSLSSEQLKSVDGLLNAFLK